MPIAPREQDSPRRQAGRLPGEKLPVRGDGPPPEGRVAEDKVTVNACGERGPRRKSL